MERKDILLSAQRAMLGAVTTNMQAITIGYKKMPVILRVPVGGIKLVHI